MNLNDTLTNPHYYDRLYSVNHVNIPFNVTDTYMFNLQLSFRLHFPLQMFS